MALINENNLKLPGSFSAEQSVLGIILLDSEKIRDVADKLLSEFFLTPLHQRIYSVFMQMFAMGSEIEIVGVIEASIRLGIFENENDAKNYFKQLMDSVGSVSSVLSYVEIIEGKYMIRRLMEFSREIYDLAASEAEEPQKLLDFAESKIYSIRNDREIKGLVSIQHIIQKKLGELTVLAENPELAAHGSGLSTSYASLDKYIFGLNPSDLILIAGRPGMGKTTFGVNIAVNAAKKYPDKAAAIFSLEMSGEQLVSRIISSEAKLTSAQLKTGNLSKSDWKSFGEAADILSKLKIFIDDSGNISVNEMKAKLLRVKNLGVVFIDYLQLMSTNRKDGNRVNEVAEITRNLKLMAKELNVPVILASQLSRGPEGRTDKRPMLSDLRDSGSIEQDADIVMFIYRNSYYDKSDEHPNSSECIIAKNRHGEVGTIGLNFEGEYSRFTAVEYTHADNY